MRRFLLVLLGLSLWPIFGPAGPRQVQTHFLQPTAIIQKAAGKDLVSTPRADGIVSIRDYGATGDGFRDDTAAIRAAEAVAKAAGAPLVFPPGVYLISSTLEITGNHRKISGYGATIRTASDITAIQLGTDAEGSAIDIIEGLRIENGASASPKSTSCGVLLYKDTARTELRDLYIGYTSGPAGWFGRGIQVYGGESYVSAIRNCWLRYNIVGIYGGANSLVISGGYIQGGQHGIVLGLLDSHNNPDLTETDTTDAAGVGNVIENVCITNQRSADPNISYGIFVKHSQSFPMIKGCYFEGIGSGTVPNMVRGVGIQVGVTVAGAYWQVRGGCIHGCSFASVAQPIAIGGAWWGGDVRGCQVTRQTTGAGLIDATHHCATYPSRVSIGENYVPNGITKVDPSARITHSYDQSPFIPYTKEASNYAVTVADSGKLFSNAGAVGPVTFTLPRAVGYVAYGFEKYVNELMYIAPLGTQTIQGLAAGEALELQDVGDTVWLELLGGATWHIRSAATRRAWQQSGAVTHDYSAGTTAWTMTYSEAAGTLFTVTNAGGAAEAVFPAARPGWNFTVYNNSRAAITFKVAGQRGAATTDGKYSIWTMSATDCVLIFEQP